jgi:hypothetical protein
MKDRPVREDLSPQMGRCSSAQPSEVLRVLGEKGMFLEPAQEVPGMEVRGREAEPASAQSPDQVPPGPGLSWQHTALHMAAAGGWWLRLGDLRLLPPCWEGERAKLW